MRRAGSFFARWGCSECRVEEDHVQDGHLGWKEVRWLRWWCLGYIGPNMGTLSEESDVNIDTYLGCFVWFFLLGKGAVTREVSLDIWWLSAIQVYWWFHHMNWTSLRKIVRPSSKRLLMFWSLGLSMLAPWHLPPLRYFSFGVLSWSTNLPVPRAVLELEDPDQGIGDWMMDS